MCHNGLRFELKYHDGMIYEGWIFSKFIVVHKGILVITQGCTRVYEVFELG